MKQEGKLNFVVVIASGDRLKEAHARTAQNR